MGMWKGVTGGLLEPVIGFLSQDLRDEKVVAMYRSVGRAVWAEEIAMQSQSQSQAWEWSVQGTIMASVTGLNERGAV